MLVCKSDEQQIAYSEVYAPNRPDADGEFMTAEEIRKMAHEFISSGKMGQIDVYHESKKVEGCTVVESYIAQKGDPTFLEGAWVVGIYVPDKELWSKIKKGELNGFSMEALVKRQEREVEIEIPPVVTGMTSKADDGHDHTFYVTYDDKGQFRGGTTSVSNGHSHPIVAGTHTQEAEGHNHRFSSVDNVQVFVQ